MSFHNALKKQAKRAQYLVQTVQLQPFEIITPEGRSRERHRRASLTTLTSVLSQGVRVFTALITVPLALSYLGDERYGVWLIMSSLLAFLAFADLGIGNGLLNIISEAHGQNDRELAIKAVSSAFVVLSAIALLLGSILAFSYALIPWASLFNVTSALAQQEVGPAVAIFFTCFLLNLPLGIVQRIQMGYQEGYHNNIWQAAGAILGLVGVLLCIQFNLGLPAMVAAFAGAPLLATLLNGAHLWGRRYPHLRPQLRQASRSIGRKILNLSFMFLLLQLSIALAFSADNLIIAQVLGADAVTQFGVPQRLFGLLSLLVGLVLTPLWPAYGEAIANQDVNWVKVTLMRTIKLVLLLVTPLALLMVFSGKTLINLWVGDAVQPSFILLLGFGLWTILSSIGNAIVMFLNGAGIIRFQAISSVIMATVNILLSIFLTQKFGLPGPIWGTVISHTIFTLIPVAIYTKRLLDRMNLSNSQPNFR
jgi:O-antigen/teichoic acid export membrane protein